MSKLFGGIPSERIQNVPGIYPGGVMPFGPEAEIIDMGFGGMIGG